jgi:glutamate 5-kinase
MSAGGPMNRLPIRKEILPLSTIVVKVGSRILTAPGAENRIERLAEDIAALHDAKIRVVLVSSGAIAHGMEALRMTKRPSTIPLQQACASVGQNRLMNRYEACFSRHNLLIGQVLLTWDDLRSKKRYLNLRNTMFALFDNGVIPVVNENDSVGVEEIRFGTNDILGAQIAILVQADVLVNLTDVGGLYDRNPHDDPSARHIPVVPASRGEWSALLKLASDKNNEISVGGMSSKIKAADMATRAGIATLIGDGYHRRLTEVLSGGENGTLFLPFRRRMSSRHRWIAFSGSSLGALIVDDGAKRAVLEKGKSLLPAGIREVDGLFKAGDNIDIRSFDGTVFARGLVNYSADEIRTIKGCKSSEIEAHLGKKEFDEVVHRDNLVIL